MVFEKKRSWVCVMEKVRVIFWIALCHHIIFATVGAADLGDGGRHFPFFWSKVLQRHFLLVMLIFILCAVRFSYLLKLHRIALVCVAKSQTLLHRLCMPLDVERNVIAIHSLALIVNAATTFLDHSWPS